MGFPLYGALLLLWLPLLPPAVQMRGRGRRFLVAVMAAGLLANLYEAWMTFVWSHQVSAPIRLDIPLVCLVLMTLYGSAAGVLFGAGRWKGAALLAVALLAIGGGLVGEWNSGMKEVKRLTGLLATRNALLFEAKFRSRESYEAYFGLAGASSSPYPAGHWAAEGDRLYTRLIINPAGRVWLFNRCGDTECDIGPDGSGLQAQPNAAGWRATVSKRGMFERTLTIARDAPDRLSVRIDQWPARFVRAEPPIAAAPPRESLRYLGPFSQAEFLRQHAVVSQVWLWQAADRMQAVGVFATLVAGARADFVLSSVMGEGVREGEAWAFRFVQGGRTCRAWITPKGSDVALRLERDGQAQPPVLLGPRPIFQDESIELASRTTPEDWSRWVQTVLSSHFASGDIPSCPGHVSGTLDRGGRFEQPIERLILRLAPTPDRRGWSVGLFDAAAPGANLLEHAGRARLLPGARSGNRFDRVSGGALDLDLLDAALEPAGPGTPPGFRSIRFQACLRAPGRT